MKLSLFDSEWTWVKKDGNSLLDVAERSYDRAVVEVIGLFLLGEPSCLLKKETSGLYME